MVERDRGIAEHRDELLTTKLDRTNSVPCRRVRAKRKLEPHSLRGQHFDEKIEWLRDEHGIRLHAIPHLQRQLIERRRRWRRCHRLLKKKRERDQAHRRSLVSRWRKKRSNGSTTPP